MSERKSRLSRRNFLLAVGAGGAGAAAAMLAKGVPQAEISAGRGMKPSARAIMSPSTFAITTEPLKSDT